MLRLLKKIIILIISAPLTLKDQECTVKKVIIGNDYMTFPYKIGVDRCIGSCNSKNNPYYKICLLDSIKNISVKSLDLISQKLVFNNISFYKTCKCGCLLDEKVCNNLQRRNDNKCRGECLKIKKCNIGYSWSVNNCRCEMKQLAALIETEECDVETDEIRNVSECKAFAENKTITFIKKVTDCKPFIGVSILFICVSIILTGIMIYFYLKSKNNNVLPY